jgi:multidrug resistance efflux pump
MADRRTLNKLDRTIAKLEAAITAAKTRHEETHASYRQQLEDKNEQHGKEMEIEYQRRQALEAQIVVLQSDRDRLTATVEILSRRLASPAADRDVTRGGWRANGLSPSDFERMLRATSRSPIENLVARSGDL